MRFSKPFGNLSQFLAADICAPHKFERLHRDIVVSASLSETFAFFVDPANLQRITPPWLHFSIVTPMPVRMQIGLEIAYRISLYGLPMPWRSRIDLWQPGVRFVDRQIVGPYRWWRHEHRFEAVPDGTRVIDQVDYAPRAGWLSGAFVRRDLARIFDYRHEALQWIFQGERRDKRRPSWTSEDVAPTADALSLDSTVGRYGSRVGGHTGSTNARR